jgi:hypothetical protein
MCNEVTDLEIYVENVQVIIVIGMGNNYDVLIVSGSC